MKTRFLYIVVFLPFLFIGCKGKYCPGFPDNLSAFIPYATNDEMLFVGNGCDSVIMTVINRHQQSPQYIEWGCKCDCLYPTYNVNLSFEGLDTDLSGTAITICAFVPHFRENATENELGFHINKGYSDFIYYPGNYEYDTPDFNYQKTNDTVLFTSVSDSNFLDSLVLIKNIGLESFRTAYGHTYHLAK